MLTTARLFSRLSQKEKSSSQLIRRSPVWSLRLLCLNQYQIPAGCEVSQCLCHVKDPTSAADLKMLFHHMLTFGFLFETDAAWLNQKTFLRFGQMPDEKAGQSQNTFLYCNKGHEEGHWLLVVPIYNISQLYFVLPLVSKMHKYLFGFIFVSTTTCLQQSNFRTLRAY